VNVAADTNDRPFHLGEAQISTGWTIVWELPPPPNECGTVNCFFVEVGKADATTVITNSGTEPPRVPPPFSN
jgi:hypothetical protein